MILVRSFTILLATFSPAAAQDAALISAAKRTLEMAQPPSFSSKREHCGLIGQLPGARFAATRPKRGGADSCRPREFRRDVQVMASYHTHGSYDPEADSEVPSSTDVIADMEEGVFGFVATPGGRMWMIDPVSGIAQMICGLGCLSQDPDFIEHPADNIRARYTLRQLHLRERGG